MATKFPSIALNVADGNTVPAIEFFDYPVFPNIGSGTVAKLYWDTPIAAENAVAHYILDIKVYDKAADTLTSVFTGNIGDVNEFYITSSMLSGVTIVNYKLYIYLTAVSKYGAAYNSPVSSAIVYVCDACGTYMKVEAGYPKPVMKRTVAFAKLGYKALKDQYGKVLTDGDGKALYGKASSMQDNGVGWTPMQDFYTKDIGGNWHPSDIQYEVLTDASGAIITDANDEPIYTL